MHLRWIAMLGLAAVGLIDCGAAFPEVVLPAAPKLTLPSLEPKVEWKEEPPRGGFFGSMFNCGGVHGPQVNGLIELFGGTDNFRTVLASARVEVVTLRRGGGVDGGSDGFVEKRPHFLGEAAATALRTILTDDATYDWDDMEWSEPNYDVRLKFRRGGDVVWVDLCREEQLLRVVVEGRQIAERSFGQRHADIDQILTQSR
jgi:hypothetical protein